jgi:nucleoside-diphosphate-sugar epimerase
LPGIAAKQCRKLAKGEGKAITMEILITGGNGFLGRHLVMALRERGDNVRVLALPAEDTSWLQSNGVPVLRGDIRNPDALTAPMRGVDGVFHLAAMIGAWRPMQDYYAVNVTGTENVCRAALASGVRRIVHISSAMVYNMAIGRPVTEDDSLAPLDEPYCMTKAQGDRIVQRMIAEDRLPAVIIRPGTLFGPGDHLNFGRLADRVHARKAIIIGSGRNAVPFVYVTDMVQGLLMAMDHERAVGQAYNIGGDQLLSQRALLALIAQELGVAPPRIHVPYRMLYAAAYAAERMAAFGGSRIPPFVTRHGVKLYGANNQLSIEKARRELGYVPQVPLREGVRAATAWYAHQDSRAPENVPNVATGR